jgi:LysR family transcriptional regulator, transcriptional activator of nhaA
MERLNYHHLLYFYTVAREGSVVRASRRLGLKQPTVSAQIHALEQRFGHKLLERSGRGLMVTPAGELVLRYAESIFALGGELLSAIDGHAEQVPKLGIGVSSSLPSALAATLLKAVLGLKPRPALTILEGTTEALAAQLASRTLHFALTDVQPGNSVARGLHSRVLLETVVEVFAPEALARKLRKGFPAHLSDVPVLMPQNGALRREVESWLQSRKQSTEKIAEMPRPEMFAASASAAIFAPSLLWDALKKFHGLLPVGQLEGSRWRVFVVTAGKGVRSPAVDAVARVAKGLQ